jgi:hypothetical protein
MIRINGFMIRKIGFVLLCSLPAMAAISGIVTNGTTGKPQADTKITLYKFGQGGMEPVADTKTDPQGAFNFDQAPAAQGPSMLRVEIDNVTYNHIMPPGSPTTGLTLDVYNTSKQPGEAKVGKHMILFQPDGNGQMTVSETFLVENTGKTTWADPADGTLHFYLPEAAKGQVTVQATAPDGMAVPAPADKSSKPDVFAAKFECKPGETRFDVNYTVPYTAGQPYSGKIVSGDQNTYLVAPAGVQLEAANLQDMGVEPRTQSHIYGFAGAAYTVKLTGAVAAAPAAGSSDAAAPDTSDEPTLDVVLPHLMRSSRWYIMGITFGILLLGFVLLYRAPSGKETNERSRG